MIQTNHLLVIIIILLVFLIYKYKQQQNEIYLLKVEKMTNDCVGADMQTISTLATLAKNISTGGGITIPGDVTIDGTLTVSDATTLDDTLTVKQTATINGTLELISSSPMMEFHGTKNPGQIAFYLTGAKDSLIGNIYGNTTPGLTIDGNLSLYKGEITADSANITDKATIKTLDVSGEITTGSIGCAGDIIVKNGNISTENGDFTGTNVILTGEITADSASITDKAKIGSLQVVENATVGGNTTLSGGTFVGTANFDNIKTSTISLTPNPAYNISDTPGVFYFDGKYYRGYQGSAQVAGAPDFSNTYIQLGNT